MIDYREYQARLNRHLDERRDPLDDAQLVAFLDAHPEHLQAFAAGRADLAEIATQTPAAPHQSQPTGSQPAGRRWLYAAAAAALFTLGWIAASGTGANEPTNSTQHTDLPSRPSRILSATLREVEPTLRPTAFYTVRDNLVQTATITLEAYEQRSELR